MTWRTKTLATSTPPKSGTLNRYLTEYRAYDQRSAILVAQWAVTTAAVALRAEPTLHVRRDRGRLCRCHQFSAFLKGNPQDLEIVIDTLDDSQPYRLLLCRRIGTFYPSFDDESHKRDLRILKD
jgi:hypothetical protein